MNYSEGLEQLPLPFKSSCIMLLIFKNIFLFILYWRHIQTERGFCIAWLHRHKGKSTTPIIFKCDFNEEWVLFAPDLDIDEKLLGKRDLLKLKVSFYKGCPFVSLSHVVYKSFFISLVNSDMKSNQLTWITISLFYF